MPLLEFRQERELIRAEEFPYDTVGEEEFHEILRWLETVDESVPVAEIDRQLGKLRALDGPQLTCPRLFVSHRSIDAPQALAIGRIALQAGFDIWIDVLDPSLAVLVRMPNSVQKAIATALVVEMALLNCSHLLAIMTANTAGSWWVPYEYGRVKQRQLTVSNAAAWLDASFQNLLHVGPTGPLPVTPEYLYLGEQLQRRAELDNWLSSELFNWQVAHPYASCPSKQWRYGETVPIR